MTTNDGAHIDEVHASELAKWMQLKRFVIHVPEDANGKKLGFVHVTPDGEDIRGGIQVKGGETFVLLFRFEDGKRIQACWITDGQYSRGSGTNPFPTGLQMASPADGPIKDGTWIWRADKGSISMGPTAPYGIKVALTDFDWPDG